MGAKIVIANILCSAFLLRVEIPQKCSVYSSPYNNRRAVLALALFLSPAPSVFISNPSL